MLDGKIKADTNDPNLKLSRNEFLDAGQDFELEGKLKNK